MKQSVEIPDYITLGQMLALAELRGLSATDSTIKTIALVLGEPEEEIRKWPVDGAMRVAKAIIDLQNQQAEFYPVFEFNGQLYGYRQLSKMQLDEYIDLDTLCQDVQKNIDQIAAILFRPIESHRIKSTKFVVKDTFRRVAYNDSESIFGYYDLVTYSNKTRKEVAEEVKGLPFNLVSGGVNFFLTVGLRYIQDTPTSSLPNLKTLVNKKMNLEKVLLQSTTAGSTRYTPWHRLPSFQSGVRKASMS
jgi:hypothetical protein